VKLQTYLILLSSMIIPLQYDRKPIPIRSLPIRVPMPRLIAHIITTRLPRLRTQSQRAHRVREVPERVELAAMRRRIGIAPVPVVHLLAKVAVPDAGCGGRVALVVHLVTGDEVAALETADEGAAFVGVRSPLGVVWVVIVPESGGEGGGVARGVVLGKWSNGGAARVGRYYASCGEEGEGECGDHD